MLFVFVFGSGKKTACVVVLFLVVSTTDVVEIVLNFTAVNFISAFDDVGKKNYSMSLYFEGIEIESNEIELTFSSVYFLLCFFPNHLFFFS